MYKINGDLKQMSHKSLYITPQVISCTKLHKKY